MGRSVSELADYVVGYTDVSVCGYYTEELLNAMKNDGVDVWNVDRADNYTVNFRIYSYSLERVASLSESTRTLRENQLQVLGSSSLLEDILRYRLRSGIAVGAVISLVLFLFMSSFIWKIEISGLTTVPHEDFLNSLAKNGIEIGSPVSGHDFQQIKYALMREYDEIAYVTVNMRGSKAEVEVTESVLPPEVVDAKAYCNIFAKCDGQIVSFETYMGLPQFEVNDAVCKGDMLVSGVYNSKVIGFRLVHADASVMARTRRTYTEFCPFRVTEEVETGRKEEYFTLKFFGLELDLTFFKKTEFEKYEAVSEETELCLGDNTVLPVSLVKTVLYEREDVDFLYGEAEALEHMEKALDERMRISLHGLEIENVTKTVTPAENGVYCTYDCTVIEDICQAREIQFELKE